MLIAFVKMDVANCIDLPLSKFAKMCKVVWEGLLLREDGWTTIWDGNRLITLSFDGIFQMKYFSAAIDGGVIGP